MLKAAVALICLLGVRANAEVSAQTDKVYKMKWVLAHEPIQVFERAAKHFAEEVAKQTDNKVQIEIINATDLNKGRPMSMDTVYSMLQKNEVQMTQTYTTYLGNHSKPFWALDLPFLFRDHDHAAHVLEGPIGKKIMSGLVASNVQGLAFTYSGGFMILPTAKKEIHSVADFKGLKVQVNNNSPVGTALMKQLGAIPVAVNDRSSKEIEGFETTYVRLVKMPEATIKQNGNVVNDLRHSLFLTAILINKDYLESMPVKYREAIQQAAMNAAKQERADSIHDTETTRQDLVNKGFKIVSMDAAQTAQFKAAAAPVYSKFEPVFGKDLIQGIQQDK